MWIQVHVVLKMHSKEKFSSKEFGFDPGGNSDLSTLEDGYDSRMNHFEERGNYKNPSMIRNLNPIRIQDNNESPSTTRNPSLTMIQDVTRNPSPVRIQNVARNPSPIRIEDPL